MAAHARGALYFTCALGVACVLAALGSMTAAAQPGSIRFVAARSLAAGNQPFGVAAGDLNGDHVADLAVANIEGLSVSVLLGNGDGSFRTQQQFSTAGKPSHVAIGDLNGDGKPDLVAANYTTASVSVFLGVGDGTFPSRTDITVGDHPFSVAIADVNGDAKPDLAVANEFSNTVSVLLGNGLGGFAPKHDYLLGTSPTAVAVTDLSGDGRPDLAVANYGSGVVSVLIGNGDGTFVPRRDYVSGPHPWSVAVGDANGDGKPDLVFANGEEPSVSLLLGNGDGSFGGRIAIPAKPYARGATLADMDLDGRQDLVVASNSTSSLSVMLGNGNGTFGPRLDFAVGTNPTAVAVADLDGDGHLDVVTSDQSSNDVSVLLQELRPPSSTALVSSPDPTVFGQATTLTATVSPGVPSGTVTFYEGTTLLGSGGLSLGAASLVVSSLTTGAHTLTASYGGDAGHAPSTSPASPHTVNRAGTASSVISSVNPSLYLQAVSFTATVLASAPGAGTPSGPVQFTIDNVNFGPTAMLVGGRATSASTSALSIGTHEVRALYGGDGNFSAAAAVVLSHAVQSSSPVIVAVRDVPRDQGGRVSLTWRSPLDQPGIKVVTGYRVWRRAPDPRAVPGARAGAGDPELEHARRTADRGRDTLGGARAQEDFWEAIATLPAEQLVSYAYTAPTLQDSMAGSNPYTTFFVAALTADPFVYMNSAPASGYSVDDLSPPTPMPFAAFYGLSSTTLHWAASPAPDLREFRLYSGPSPDFIPGPAQLVIATRDTGYVDALHTFYYYKLAAVDIHGNTSRFAAVSPNGPVAALASLVAIEPGPDRIRLAWHAAGGPGLSATVYRRTASSDWSALVTIESDGLGDLRYEDATVRTGERYGYRLGIVDGTSELFVGEAWALAERAVFALEGARPNPAPGGALTVAFSLPDAAPARLELIDVSGRRMVARDVGALGPGRHTLDLAANRRVPPGIYLVRLTQSGNARTVRAVVLD